MALTHGMDLVAVRGMADKIQAAADQLGEIEKATETISNQATQVWLGRDSEAFRDWWVNQHRPELLRLISVLEGLVRSARNNADEQVRASGGGGIASTLLDKARDLIPPPEEAAQPSSAGNSPGGEAGVLSGAGRSWQDVQATYDRDYVAKYGLWPDGGPSGANKYQCVSWAWYRMRELGSDIGQVQGDGGVLAERLGGTPDTTPKLGAVVSYSDGRYGHVMIAEELSVDSAGNMTMRVSEMNAGDLSVNATPDEYRDNRVFTRQPDGTWSDAAGRRRTFVIANPNYP